jgi:hypothetical protein
MHLSWQLSIAQATIRSIFLVLWVGNFDVLGQDSFMEGSCTTAGTKTKPTGSVLIQSASARAQLTVAEATANRQDAVLHESEKSLQIDFQAFFVNHTSILNAAHEIMDDVLRHVSAEWPSLRVSTNLSETTEKSTVTRSDMSMLILTCVFLVTLGGLAIWLLQQFSGLRNTSRRDMSSERLNQQRFEQAPYPRTAPKSPILNQNVSPAPSVQDAREFINKPPNQGFPGSYLGSSTPPPPMGSGSASRGTSPRMAYRDGSFCPELIVPQQSECILLMPIDSARRSSSFEVTDVNGNIVLRVVPEQPRFGNLWRASIQTANGELLAQCCEARYQPSSGAAREFLLLRAGGDTYGKLRHSPAQDRYLLTLVNGTSLHFWGNFENQSVNFTDDKDRLFATTETGVSADFDPRGQYCRLRIAPLVDVGLTLCGLLCIGQHMTDQKTMGFM